MSKPAGTGYPESDSSSYAKQLKLAGVPDAIQAVQQRAICLFTADQVQVAIDRMALAIHAKLAESNPLLLCVLTGANMVTEQLRARLKFPLQVDSLHATRYRDGTSGSKLEWRKYPKHALSGRTVLVIDDILDEGATLEGIVEYCKSQQCQRVYTAVLVNKIHSRKLAPIKADFVGLDADDFYLFGSGMDYKGYLRDAPGIFAVAAQDL